MSAETMAALAQNPKLLADFRIDPIATIKVIEQLTGGNLGNLSVSDIELIKTFSDDEFKVFFAVTQRMKAMNKPRFKL